MNRQHINNKLSHVLMPCIGVSPFALCNVRLQPKQEVMYGQVYTLQEVNISASAVLVVFVKRKQT